MMGIRPWEVEQLTWAEYELFTGVLDAQQTTPDPDARLNAHHDRLKRIK